MNRFNNVNVFSLVITILYISSIFSVQYQSGASLIEDLLFGIPVYAIFLIWSQRSSRLIYENELSENIKVIFARDIFLISYSFYFSSLISLILQYQNVDLRGWWPFYIYFVTAIGFIFSLAFSLFASVLNRHKIYTLIFSLFIVIVFSTISFFPAHIQLGFLDGFETFWVFLGCALIFHVLICFFKLCKNFVVAHFNRFNKKTDPK